MEEYQEQIKERKNAEETGMPHAEDKLHARIVKKSKTPTMNEFLFPDELNSQLRMQITDLTVENGALRRSLMEKDSALERIMSSSRVPSGDWRIGMANGGPLTCHFGVGRASELAASKIVELSKRVRELTAELEAERCRGRGNKARMEGGDAEEAGGEREGGGEKGLKKGMKRGKQGLNEDGSETVDEKSELKILKDKLSITNTKLAEYRNQCQTLKQELKVADKILASEVGDSTTLDAAKASMGSTTPSLGESVPWRGRAQQVTLLKNKVAELQEKLKKMESMNQDALAGQRDMHGCEDIKREREMRLAEVQRLEASFEEAERRACDWKRKADVSGARSAALRAEADALRTRLSTILTKAEHDDQLIATLNDCLKAKDSIIREKESKITAKVEQCKQEKEDMMVELMKEKAKLSHLEDELKKKDFIIDKLKHTAEDMVSSNDTRINASTSSPASNYSRASLNELQVLAQTSEAERMRLLELVAVLNRRLKEEQEKMDQASKCLRTERRKNAFLETKVAYLEMESTPARNNQHKYSYRKSPHSDEKKFIPDDVRHRLELLEEEKLVLESRIECLNQEKEEDLRHYATILRETREVFQAKIEQMDESKQLT